MSATVDFRFDLNDSSENSASRTGNVTGTLLLTAGLTEGDADGDGVADELELLPGSGAQPVATKTDRIGRMSAMRIIREYIWFLVLSRIEEQRDSRSLLIVQQRAFPQPFAA